MEHEALKKPENSGDTTSTGLSPTLALVVFSSGASIMALEILGSRFLAPYFGNSVFVWGSLISVFLLSLSVGYLIGGKLADRLPKAWIAGVLALISAVLILFAGKAAAWVCGAVLGLGFGEVYGPLLAACVLYLPASLVMGMVSPHAIRVVVQGVSTVGTIAGRLYALSTVGSIVGSLAATFWLIPNFGISDIVVGVAIFQALAGAVLLISNARYASAAAGVMTIMILSWAVDYSMPVYAGEGAKVVLVKETPYHRMAVVDTPDGARSLMFDKYYETSIALEPPHKSLLPYTNYFNLALALTGSEAERATFIGAGGGVGPRAFHEYAPHMVIDVVDIDEAVLELAESHFYMPVNERVRPYARDGRMFMAGMDEGVTDIVVIDAFTIGGRIPFHLITQEFFETCRRAMTEDGVFVININSALQGPRSQIFHAVSATLQEVFPTVVFYAEGSRKRSPSQTTNVVFFAVNTEQDLHARITRGAERWEDGRTWLTREQLLELVKDFPGPIEHPAETPVFTDDYCPIETMSF